MSDGQSWMYAVWVWGWGWLGLSKVRKGELGLGVGVVVGGIRRHDRSDDGGYHVQRYG